MSGIGNKLFSRNGNLLPLSVRRAGAAAAVGVVVLGGGDLTSGCAAVKDGAKVGGDVGYGVFADVIPGLACVAAHAAVYARDHPGAWPPTKSLGQLWATLATCGEGNGAAEPSKSGSSTPASHSTPESPSSLPASVLAAEVSKLNSLGWIDVHVVENGELTAIGSYDPQSIKNACRMDFENISSSVTGNGNKETVKVNIAVIPQDGPDGLDPYTSPRSSLKGFPPALAVLGDNLNSTEAYEILQQGLGNTYPYICAED